MKDKSPKSVVKTSRKQSSVPGQVLVPPPYEISFVDQQSVSDNAAIQRVAESSSGKSISANPNDHVLRPNKTGLPDNLKGGIENLSGYSMEDVKVHYNSAKPAQLEAYAYTQGTDIHVAPGQEKHLPHEAWHVVQQKQGKVKPTIQMKEVSVNDDARLEHEADVMGAKALQTQIRTSAPMAPASEATASRTVQRVIRYTDDKNFTVFVSELKQLPLSEKEFASYLTPLIESADLHGFENIKALKDYAGLLKAHYELLIIMQSATFRRYAAAKVPVHMQLRVWMINELLELQRTNSDQKTTQGAQSLIQSLAKPVDQSTIIPLVLQVYNFLLTANLNMFSLGADRKNKTADGKGDLENMIYGYHLTKIHNLPGIAQKGLDPGEGAKARGSLAMSTKDQAVGSAVTSKDVIAFGMQPSTFRPYINQFADRRQMIEGTPAELKPVMLRFKISDQVRKNAIKLRETTVGDFMDESARNSKIPILANDIEVLTKIGWLKITALLGDMRLYHEMRDGNENSRQGDKWEGEMAIFDWEELEEVMKIKKIAQEKWKGADAGKNDPVELLKNLRDTEVGTYSKITYTFRGATLQTSGNWTTWDYAFSVQYEGETPPKWLSKKILKYKENYGDRAGSQIQDYENQNKPVKTDEPKKTNKNKIDQLFKVGNASGNELNCLLETIDQLSRNQEGANQQNVQTMRAILSGLNLAPAVGMIDIYGGAGMQLANDLNLRIQVIQEVNNEYIVHPIMGLAGRLVYILHTPGHFQPLWNKEN